MVPIETFYISSYSTHYKEQADIKIFAQKKWGKVMTAQICVQISVKFRGFGCGLGHY